MVYAFITFRSMEGYNLYDRAYRKFEKRSTRCCYRTFKCLFCGCCTKCKRNHQQLMSLYIGSTWPSPKPGIVPDNIYWENLSVGSFSLFLRRSISFIIGLAILVGAIGSILYLTTAKDLFDNEFKEPKECRPNITKEKAYLDHIAKKPKGFMHCFCNSEVVEK